LLKPAKGKGKGLGSLTLFPHASRATLPRASPVGDFNECIADLDPNAAIQLFLPESL